MVSKELKQGLKENELKTKVVGFGGDDSKVCKALL